MPQKGLYPFFIATYLAQGLVGIAYVPIYYLQKDVLRLTPAQSAVFTLVMTLPFLLKPLLGLLTDAFPLFRRRRGPYILLASAATSAAWAALATLPVYHYSSTLFLLTAVNVGIAFADVLCDAVMVEFGKSSDKTGLFQAVQIGVLYLSLFASGVGGGWLAEHASYRLIFGLTALFPALILLSSLCVPECEARPPAAQARRAWDGLWGLLSSRPFWACCLVIFLFDFNPFLGTSLFYYQSGPLGFSKFFIGALTSLAGAAGAVGAFLFWRLYNRRVRLFGRERVLDTVELMRLSIVVGGPLTLLYLGYRGPWSAALLTVLFGTAGVFMRLAMMDVAAKMCPQEGEATAFALFMAVFNLSALASNTAGAWLYERGAAGGHPHAAMSALAALAALCTLSCLGLLRGVTLRAPRVEAAAPALTTQEVL